MQTLWTTILPTGLSRSAKCGPRRSRSAREASQASRPPPLHPRSAPRAVRAEKRPPGAFPHPPAPAPRRANPSEPRRPALNFRLPIRDPLQPCLTRGPPLRTFPALLAIVLQSPGAFCAPDSRPATPLTTIRQSLYDKHLASCLLGVALLSWPQEGIGFHRCTNKIGTHSVPSRCENSFRIGDRQPKGRASAHKTPVIFAMRSTHRPKRSPA